MGRTIEVTWSRSSHEPEVAGADLTIKFDEGVVAKDLLEGKLISIRRALASNGIKSVYDSPPEYDSRCLALLLKYHRLLTEKYGVPDGYDRYAGINEEPMINQSLYEFSQQGTDDEPTKVELKMFAGPLGACSPELGAAIIHDQAASYLNEGTMGNFPKGNTKMEEKFAAVMIGGCSPTDAIVVIYTESTRVGQRTIKPISGCKLKFGESAASVESLNGNPDSVLPTLASLDLQNDGLNKMNSVFRAQYGTDLTEQDLVCPSRLFSNKTPKRLRNLLNPLGITLAQIVIAMLPQVYVMAARQGGRAAASVVIFDTHLPSLVELTTKAYGAKVIAQDGEVQPTAAVTDSDTLDGGVLRFHYADDDIHEKITVAGMLTGDFVEGSVRMIEAFNKHPQSPFKLPILVRDFPEEE